MELNTFTNSLVFHFLLLQILRQTGKKDSRWWQKANFKTN